VKIYKASSSKGVFQFSFVIDDWGYYFIYRYPLCRDWSKMWYIRSKWGTTNVANSSTESSWLEVLLLTGKSRRQIRKEIKDWKKG